jgi:hypothetical protein
VGVCLLLGFSVPRAGASMALLLEEPYGGLGHVNPTGHSAIYLDHICAATPVKLRPCGPGELGVVISRYDGIGHYDWLAIPLIPYLYAVEQPSEIPENVDRSSVAFLRDRYRRQYLEEIEPDLSDGGTPDGNWYELVGSAYDRTSYGFSIATTPEQDAELIAIFNDLRNEERYNGAFRNCADFARVTINRLYPHAVRRNFIADFGLTTPKSVARGLTHYASKHPELGIKFFVIPQVEGSLPRSHAVEDVTESLLKRYGVPLVILSPMATGVVFVAYMGHGRFDEPRDAPVLDLRQPDLEMAEAAVSAVNGHEAALPNAAPRTAESAESTGSEGARVLLGAPPASLVALPLSSKPASDLPALLSSPLSSPFNSPAPAGLGDFTANE